MSVQQRQIFRASALKRYAQAHDKPVLPRFISPPIFFCLWLLVCVLLAGGALVMAVRVPVYAAGSAVISTEESGGQRPTGENLQVVAFLPAAALPRLRVGQKLLLRPQGAGPSLSARIVAVEGLSGPEAIHHRFKLGTCEPPFGVALAVVVRAEAQGGGASSVRAEDLTRSSWRAEAEVGSRRVATLLPVVGRFLGD